MKSDILIYVQRPTSARAGSRRGLSWFLPYEAFSWISTGSQVGLGRFPSAVECVIVMQPPGT